MRNEELNTKLRELEQAEQASEKSAWELAIGLLFEALRSAYKSDGTGVRINWLKFFVILLREAVTVAAALIKHDSSKGLIK